MTEPVYSSRRSIRLRRYDYSRAGSYFFTICAAGHESILGRVRTGKMECNSAGDAVWNVWRELPARFPTIELDAFVVMPNHVHGILFLCSPNPPSGRASPAPTKTTAVVRRGDPWVARRDSPSRVSHCGVNVATNPVSVRSPSLGEIIGAFKSLSAAAANRALNRHGQSVWQRNYYEHIVRSSKDLDAVRLYITQNPTQWLNDRENPEARQRIS